ncbi:MAG: S41 family peptidase [Candidatus Eremiobacteraeota bacterium]|nr:S41 family peptidase [Candidatus Eremiobacteraeota bacterium]
MLATTGGQTDELRRRLTSLRFVLFALLGGAERYRVAFVTPQGTRGARTVVAAPRAVLDVVAASVAPPEPDYAIRVVDDVAVLDYRACRDLARFEAFLHKAVPRIRGSRALIVDIRENRGGDSELNDRLWRLFARHPFRQVASSLAKVSARAKRTFGRPRFEAIYGEGTWRLPDGTSWYRSEAFIEPAPAAERLRVPVFLLIGPGTMSSAFGCAVAAKEFGIARLVGEPTAEPIVTTGEVLALRCARSGLAYNVTTKLYFGSDHGTSIVGVQPDVLVPTSSADLRAGRDPVFERAMELAHA